MSCSRCLLSLGHLQERLLQPARLGGQLVQLNSVEEGNVADLRGRASHDSQPTVFVFGGQSGHRRRDQGVAKLFGFWRANEHAARADVEVGELALLDQTTLCLLYTSDAA